MLEKEKEIELDEVLENEVDDIWDIFFPYMAERKEAAEVAAVTIDADEKIKPRRYLKFLSM